MTLYAELRQLQFWSRLTGQLDSQIEILISRLDDVPSQNVSILRIWESRAFAQAIQLHLSFMDSGLCRCPIWPDRPVSVTLGI